MNLKGRFAEIEAQHRRPQKVLTLDIETSPNVVYAWGLWQQNVAISQIIEPSRVLCVAAKWLHESKVQYVSEFHDGRDAMLAQVWQWYDEADVIVSYNGVRFDNPHVMRELLLAGYGKPSPWVDIDLLAVNRQMFKFPSNKLAYVTDVVGLPTKLETGGQSLWNAVLADDAKAWEKFKRYNVNDVKITEQLYRFLLPWIKVPHRGQWNGNPSCCYSCGGTNLTLVGLMYSKSLAYPKVKCVCGAVNKVLRNGQTRAC